MLLLLYFHLFPLLVKWSTFSLPKSQWHATILR